MLYFYCIENEKGKTSGIALYNEKISTIEDGDKFIDFIYSETKKLYGDKFTRENSIIVSISKL